MSRSLNVPAPSGAAFGVATQEPRLKPQVHPTRVVLAPAASCHTLAAPRLPGLTPSRPDLRYNPLHESQTPADHAGFSRRCDGFRANRFFPGEDRPQGADQTIVLYAIDGGLEAVERRDVSGGAAAGRGGIRHGAAGAVAGAEEVWPDVLHRGGRRSIDSKRHHPQGTARSDGHVAHSIYRHLRGERSSERSDRRRARKGCRSPKAPRTPSSF